MSADRRTSRTAIEVTLALCALAAPAAANGRFPSAQWVALGPAPSSEVVALQTTFGTLLSRDRGASFHWVCEEAIFAPAAPPSQSDTPVAVASDGRVVFGTPDGVRTLREGCDARPDGAAPRMPVEDLAWTPDGATLYAIETPGVGAHRVLRATAPSFAFSPLGEGVTDTRLNAVDVAPSDPARLYLSGATSRDAAPVLLRSDDGGASLRRLTVSASLGGAAYVSGVDPRAPDTLWVRTLEGLGSALLVTRDGGMSFTRAADTRDRMLGFALSDDGTTVWYGTPGAGLFRSDDGGRSFARVSRVPILCLRFHAGTLWACTDWVQQPWALGRSRDGGQTFEGVLRWAALQGPTSCAPDTTVAQQCTPRWEAQRRQLVGLDVLPDAGSAPADAPVMDVPVMDVPAADATSAPIASPDRGCGVGRGPAGRAALGGVCAAVALRRRRRARRG